MRAAKQVPLGYTLGVCTAEGAPAGGGWGVAAQRRTPHTRRRQPPPAKAALGAALARFDNRPNCPAHQPLPSHCVSGSGARGIRSPLNRQCHPPYQFREISTVKFAPAAPRKEVLKRSFKWRFWLLLSPGTKVTRARERETLPPAPAGAASSAAVAAPPQKNIKKRPPCGLFFITFFR